MGGLQMTSLYKAKIHIYRKIRLQVELQLLECAVAPALKHITEVHNKRSVTSKHHKQKVTILHFFIPPKEIECLQVRISVTYALLLTLSMVQHIPILEV